MKSTLLLLMGLPATAFYIGIKKIQGLKQAIKNLDIKLNIIYDINLDFLQNQASFHADFSIHNPTENDLKIQSAGLVTLKRILFYDREENLIASAVIDINNISIAKGQSIELGKIPFRTKLTNGIQKLQKSLKNKNNEDLLIELELIAFNKIYKTGLK